MNEPEPKYEATLLSHPLVRYHECPALYDHNTRCFYSGEPCTYIVSDECVLSRRSAVPHAERIKKAILLTEQQTSIDDCM